MELSWKTLLKSILELSQSEAICYLYWKLHLNLNSMLDSLTVKCSNKFLMNIIKKRIFFVGLRAFLAYQLLCINEVHKIIYLLCLTQKDPCQCGKVKEAIFTARPAVFKWLIEIDRDKGEAVA
jgi:hypothetical protein